jgi:hypothetical protein
VRKECFIQLTGLNTKTKRPFGRHRRRWQNIIKIEVQRNRLAIRLQSSGSNRAFLNMVMNLRVRKPAGKLLHKALVTSEALSYMDLFNEAGL